VPQLTNVKSAKLEPRPLPCNQNLSGARDLVAKVLYN